MGFAGPKSWALAVCLALSPLYVANAMPLYVDARACGAPPPEGGCDNLCNRSGPYAIFNDMNAALACAQPGDLVDYYCAYDEYDPQPCVVDRFVVNASGITVRINQDDPGTVIRKTTASTDPVVEVNGNNVLLQNFHVDGNGKYNYDHNEPLARTLVRVRGNGVTLTNAVIENGAGGSCIRVDRDDSQSVLNFRLENSTVRDCIKRDALRTVDSHCVHSCNAEGMVVTNNLIERCSGDGVQLENPTAPGCNNGMGWKDVKVTYNTFRTQPVGAPLNASPGENGVDVKDGRGGLKVQFNVFRGFRSNLTTTDKGTGSGSKGEGIVVQGAMTECTGTPEQCVLIEHNTIADTNVGIAIGLVTPGGGGGPGDQKALVRRNVIHNLSPDTSDNDGGSGAAQGLGIRINGGSNIQIRHNTFVNIPGLPIYQESTSSSGVRVQYNLFSHAGKSCNLKNSGHYDSNTFTQNLCFQGPNSSSRNLCNQTLTQHPAFVRDDSGWQDTDTTCGAIPGRPSDFSLPDYHPSASSGHMINLATGSSLDGPYLNAPDHGAYEYGP